MQVVAGVRVRGAVNRADADGQGLGPERWHFTTNSRLVFRPFQGSLFGGKWHTLGEVYYIWGDTDFDSYGVHPRAPWPMSEYLFNQIVPQLSLGSGLASSDPSVRMQSALIYP